MPKNRIKEQWYWFAHWLCRIFCKVFFKMKVSGLENLPGDGAFLLISNHQSYLDPLFCGVSVRRSLYFLARATLFANWFSGRLLPSIHAIPVRRGQADLAAMKTVIEKLKQGTGVCLFPEATRTRDGRIATFKPGLGLLCRRGRAGIVPVVIDGAFECWPRDNKIFSPGKTIVVRYGQFITAEQVNEMNDRQLAEKLTDTLRQMQNHCRINHGKKPYDYQGI